MEKLVLPFIVFYRRASVLPEAVMSTVFGLPYRSEAVPPWSRAQRLDFKDVLAPSLGSRICEARVGRCMGYQ